MIRNCDCKVLTENASCIFFKFLSCINSTSNRSSRENFSFHFISPRDSSKLIHIPFPIFFLVNRETIPFFTGLRCRSFTVFTLLNIVTSEFFRILSYIILTSNLGESIFMSKFVHSSGISSIARSPSKTIDSNLRGKSNLEELIIFQDINSISQS